MDLIDIDTWPRPAVLPRQSWTEGRRIPVGKQRCHQGWGSSESASTDPWRHKFRVRAEFPCVPHPGLGQRSAGLAAASSSSLSQFSLSHDRLCAPPCFNDPRPAQPFIPNPAFSHSLILPSPQGEGLHKPEGLMNAPGLLLGEFPADSGL